MHIKVHVFLPVYTLINWSCCGNCNISLKELAPLPIQYSMTKGKGKCRRSCFDAFLGKFLGGLAILSNICLLFHTCRAWERIAGPNMSGS